MRKLFPKKREIRSLRDSSVNSNVSQYEADGLEAEKLQKQTLDADDSYQPKRLISNNIQDTILYLHSLFAKSSDVILREIVGSNQAKMLLVYVDGLVDSARIDDHVLKPLMYELGVVDEMNANPPTSIDDYMRRFLATGQSKEVENLTDAIDLVLTGDTLLFVDGYSKAVAISAKMWEHRSPSEPETEAVVRGPREGFVESLRTNTSLLRRRVRTPHLKIESMKIGRVTKTDVVLAYIDGIATESVVDEIRHRLQRIDTDSIIDSGYIEQFIEDQPFSPFPQVQPTERPDTAAGNLMEGRCIILVDGSPFGLIAPVSIWGALQANEDYYERFMYTTLIRWLRFAFSIIALTLPSMYIAITTFHQEMMPTNLLLSIAAARESSPFPALIEALMMEITFEALREAGVRLPKTVGQAVSIVGALVIGQAAVQAGIVSAPMVIVVSVTGIANFTIPRYTFALGIRMLRFPLMVLAGTLGLYGIVIGLLGIIIHICSLRSVGVPITAPVAPLTVSDLKDILLRAPVWWTYKRPRVFGYQNPVRTPKGQKPKPPNKQPS